MNPATLAYFTALHEIQHAILSAEAGTISKEQAMSDVNDTARHIPRLDREWRKELNQ